MEDVSKNATKISHQVWKKSPRALSGWQQRTLILTKDHTLWYFRPEEKIPRGGIHLSGFEVESGESDGKRDYCFFLKPKNPSGRTWSFCCESNEERRSWMNAISASLHHERMNFRTSITEEKLYTCYIPDGDIQFFGDEHNIGSGASGVVKKAIWRNSEVAIKLLNEIPEMIDEDLLTEFYSEIELLSKLHHPNIVKMFGYSKKDNFLFLVTEFVRGGHLGERIHDKQIKIDLPLLCNIGLSIAKGMIYLHSNKVIHRDLKPQNVLVETWEDGEMRVCDFGLSTVTMSYSKTISDYQAFKEGNESSGSFPMGTPAYASPELITNQKTSHTHKVDVFSFACILWELVTRDYPWKDLFPNQIMDAVGKGLRLPLPENSPFSSLIEQCWAHDPQKRPNFREIHEQLEHIKCSLESQEISS